MGDEPAHGRIQRRVSRSALTLGLGLALLLAGAETTAHDLWVLPGKFRLAAGERTTVFINSGDVFPESAALVEARRVESVLVHTTGGAEPPPALRVDRSSLVAELSVAGAGTAIVSVALKPNQIRLSADDFNDYLAQDGLPQILRLRAERDETGQPARERYTKWAKSIVGVGDAADDLWSQPVGLRLEIVPQKNPLALKAEEELPVQVIFDGVPLGGVIVIGARAGGAPALLRGWTDAKGRATFRVPEAGRWYLHVVHMVRLDNDPEAQWESFWSTLTFEVGP